MVGLLDRPLLELLVVQVNRAQQELDLVVVLDTGMVVVVHTLVELQLVQDQILEERELGLLDLTILVEVVEAPVVLVEMLDLHQDMLDLVEME